jgi:hypothetical protein
MLAHSRGGSGERRRVDINALVEEALNLAYHGARAQDQSFNITLERDLDRSMAPMELVPQEVTRVFLNLFGNGFSAATKRGREAADAAYHPVLKVATRDLAALSRSGCATTAPASRPRSETNCPSFFVTTKSTGEGTGLGLRAGVGHRPTAARGYSAADPLLHAEGDMLVAGRERAQATSEQHL